MRLSEHHKTLVDGVGKCSKPMWCGGSPAGFCDEPAYGMQTEAGRRRLIMRGDSAYCGALACPTHGGPAKP